MLFIARQQMIDDSEEEGITEGQPGMCCVCPPLSLCLGHAVWAVPEVRCLITAEPVSATRPKQKTEEGGVKGWGLWWGWGTCLAPGHIT